MEKKVENNNIRHINILKALGIIAVVLGHAGSPITSVIYLYHMALFFFVSGYLYKESYERGLKKFFIKKVKSLYITFVIFELGFVLLRNIFINLHIYSLSNVQVLHSFSDWVNVLKQIFTFNYTGDSMLGAIWFLKAMFYVSILYVIFNIVFKKVFKDNEYTKVIVVIIMAILGFYSIMKGYNPIVYFNPNNRKILGLILNLFDGRNFILLSICYFGTWYKKNEEKIPLNIYISIVFAIILNFCSKIATIDVSTYSFKNPIYFILCGLMGIYINMYLAKKLSIIKCSFLDYIGKNSLYIMLLHFLAFKLVNVFAVYYYKMPLENISGYPVLMYGGSWWITYTIIGITISLLLRYTYIQVKKLIV